MASSPEKSSAPVGAAMRTPPVTPEKQARLDAARARRLAEKEASRKARAEEDAARHARAARIVPQKPKPAPPPPQPAPAPLPAARPQRRHIGLLASLILLVLLPFLSTAVYLWAVARDQYASTVAFSVRREEAQSSLDILGGVTRLVGSTSSDTDILYDFIRSQDMVARINAQLDLRSIWASAWPDDPIFAFDPAGSIEDLHSYWLRMVRLSYDSASGIITVRANAFDPQPAYEITRAISDESSRLINGLAEEARVDATRYALAEFERARQRLTDARQALTAFRLRTQIVDIDSVLQGQMGLLSSLQAQQATALIGLDLLRETAPPNDPRIRQAERRIEVIEARIAAERARFGEGGEGPGGEDYARIAAEYEQLAVELEFAEAAHRAAQTAHDNALADAQRQSRYLAAHIRPTLAERALYPQRWLLLGLTGFFLLMGWGVGALVYYSIRDRR